MIQSASTPELQTEFLRRIAHKPYFESTLGTHLHLFGSHPASGWAFYLLPGSAVLELRGGSAVLCGALPGGEAGEDAREEWAALLTEMNAMETQEAKIYKALDKMEAVIQHNESDISTWLPLEYDLQLTYGEENVQFSPYMQQLKAEVNDWTREKIAREKPE